MARNKAVMEVDILHPHVSHPYILKEDSYTPVTSGAKL